MADQKFFNHIYHKLDKHLSAEEIKAFLISSFNKLSAQKIVSKEIRQNFSAFHFELFNLGWLDDRPDNAGEFHYTTLEISAAKKWYDLLESGSVIVQGIVVPGAGKNLDILDTQSGAYNLKVNLEKLLKHVESRREESLNRFTKNLTKLQVLGEKIDISILFSHYARRHLDLRFLNAAFKLNEWLFPKCRLPGISQRFSNYLLALVEQEKNAMELLK